MWCDAFAERVTRDRELRDLTSVRVGGRALFFVEPASDEQMGAVLAALSAEGLGYRVLGGGSNLLPPDGEIREVILHPGAMRGFAAVGEEVRVQAGLSLASMVARANGLGLAGVHVLAGIPGQVGGAVVMNAGGRYGEIGPLVKRVHVRLDDGSAESIDGNDMGFAYRQSELPEGAVVTSVVLGLDPTDDPGALRRESGRIIKEKNAAQPTTSRNFGCMFKNSDGRSAGILVEEAGLKGLVQGDARISPQHGNFIENMGGAKARDVLALIERAETVVLERFGVRLEREVRVWNS